MKTISKSKIFIVLLVFSWIFSGWPGIKQAAVSYFGSASTPADNGTNTASPTIVTPPANMQAGDLVVMIGQGRATSGTRVGFNNLDTSKRS